MSLNKLEREVLTDSMLKVQSIKASLERIDPDKVPDNEEIQDCLENAGQSFRQALKTTNTDIGPKKDFKS
jgi:hypothetical protein